MKDLKTGNVDIPAKEFESDLFINMKMYRNLKKENERLRTALAYYAENTVYIRATDDGELVDIYHIAELALEGK